MVRMSDKYIRVTNLMKTADNDQVGESLRDTLQDLAAYALIGDLLLDEEQRRCGAEGVPASGLSCDHGVLLSERCYVCARDETLVPEPPATALPGRAARRRAPIRTPGPATGARSMPTNPLSQPTAPTRACEWCSTPLVGRTARARFCDRNCLRALVRHQGQVKMRYLRPRCLVCMAPMKYGVKGRRLKARTCSKKCAQTAWRWFGRMR